MYIKMTAVAAAMTALAACSSQYVPEAIGYAYPGYWGSPARSASTPTDAANAAAQQGRQGGNAAGTNGANGAPG